MQMFKRIGFFLLTNLLVMVTIGIAWTLISQFFGLQGIHTNMASLLVFCALFGMGGAFINLFLSKFLVKSMMGVQIIKPETADPGLQSLVNRVHEYARQAGLPKMPEVGIYESDDVNAFATGRSRSNSLVAVSTGLLRRMEQKEVEGVLGHEIAHIANGDMVTMTLIAGIVNTFSMFFSRILANLIASNVDERYRGIVYFACTIAGDILFTLLGSVVVNSFSRAREYRADHGGARLAGRGSMISALKRLQALSTRPFDGTEGTDKDAYATLKISSRPSGGLAALLMTHPRLEDRIAALEKAQ